MYDKIVIVTRKSPLQELVERFNTRGQAKFVVTSAGGDFAAYEREHEAWQRSLDLVQRSLDLGLRVQTVDRAIVPTMLFSRSDIIVTVGPNGVVANTAKYVGTQPIIAVNPDPAQHEPILTPFDATQARPAVERVLADHATCRTVTLAEARTNDGQVLRALNDLFIGARTHVSARYDLALGDRTETQSSSGVIVSTGAGSTGWLSSVFNMAHGLLHFAQAPDALHDVRLAWDDRRLMFVVREPFASRHSSAEVVAGIVDDSQSLVLESRMADGGVIFSDGVESDYIAFTTGTRATIAPAAEQARLVTAE